MSGEAGYDALLEIAEHASQNDPHGYRDEFLNMIRQAKRISGS